MNTLKYFSLATMLLFFVAGNKNPDPNKPNVTWHDCQAVSEAANFAGYQSQAIIYSCKEDVVRLEGKWGIDIQDGWEYRTKFGALDGSGEYVGDLPESSQRPNFQKWCKTKYGWTLCGWNEEEQRKQDALRRVRSHHVPGWKKP